MRGQLEVTLWHDVFCPWSYVAGKRLELLREEYGDEISWAYKGYPLRPLDRLPSEREIQVFGRHHKRIRREPEGKRVVTDLWLSGDPPRSSMPPLCALHAALQQSVAAQRSMLVLFREAAFERGVNVARRDVILELASKLGLDMTRFLRDFDAQQTSRAILEEHEEAEALGLRGVPALVLGGEWLVAGARELHEYREVIARYISDHGNGTPIRLLH